MSRRYFEYAKREDSSNSGLTRGQKKFESQNKKASDRLKKSFQTLTVEEQASRSDEIDQISSSPGFTSNEFISKRNQAPGLSGEDMVDIDLDSIPLPINDKCWRENPRILIHEKLLRGTAVDRKKMWVENLKKLKALR